MKYLTQRVGLIRHGETEWSLNGRHTSYTDLPLTQNGREQAKLLKKAFSHIEFKQVFCSPLKRARETCDLAGLSENVIIVPGLTEWNYGDFEGLTTAQIEERIPDWDLFLHGCPGGESPQQVSDRADQIIGKIQEIDGNVAIFSHGHFTRALAIRWVNLPIQNGRMFVLGTATLNVLGAYHDDPAIVNWNASIDGYIHL